MPLIAGTLEAITSVFDLSDHKEELRAAYERIDELEATLIEARLQIEYLHEKFKPTGTSEAVLARIAEVL